MEFDIIYSPVFWLALNVLVAFGILRLRRSLSNAARSKAEVVVEGPFWRLERALGMEVSRERQREYLRNCVNIFLQLLEERGVLQMKPSLTFREILTSIGGREALELVELYESVRFGNKTLTDEELKAFKTKLRSIARMLIH
ncbi:MAG: DUF4129 domain-containing protein [Nitrososphaerota archaeon]|nr:DUF4129 domain-containing protein [Candidatus Calditenuaceae archaeon]MDW8073835.1 DUF4129 domain-containing protein [Nitrososphaerota archaeon]